MNYSTPFVHAFETDNHKYLYDVNTNRTLQVNNKAAKSKGLFSSFRPERIQYPKDRLEIIDLLETEIGSLTLNVTENCNMRCKYCVYGGTYQMIRTHSNKYMNLDIAKKAIEY